MPYRKSVHKHKKVLDKTLPGKLSDVMGTVLYEMKPKLPYTLEILIRNY